MRKQTRKNLSYLVLGLFTALTIGALSNPVTWVEKMFLPQNNFVNPGFEANDTGICLGDASGAAPTTDQSCSGSPSLTKSFETTSPLDGNRSIKISKGAANRQGEFVALDFTIDRSQINKSNTLEFKYSATSNFVYGDSGDIKVYIADKTTSQVYATYPNTLDASGHFKTMWQATANRNYQLLLWIPTTTTLAWDFAIDSFKNALSDWLVINSDSDWVSYTPTYTSMGSVTTVKAEYRKEGPDMLVNIKFTMPASGSSAAIARISLPSGFTIADSSRVPSRRSAGFYFRDGTATNHGGAVIVEAGLTYLQLGINSAFGSTSVNAMVPANGDDFAASNTFTIEGRIPIQGWTSGYATPAVSVQNVPVYIDTSTPTGTFADPSTLSGYTVISSSGHITESGGVFTTNVAGSFEVRGSFPSTTSALNNLALWVNGSQYNPRINANLTNGFTNVMSGIVYNVPAGTTFSIRNTNASAPNRQAGQFTIRRIETPSAFLNIPKVATLSDVKASGTDGGTFTSGSYQTRVLNTVSDPFGIVSLASNQFTLQPGTYYISAIAPVSSVERNKVKIRNITAGADALIGTTNHTGTTGIQQTISTVEGVVSISVATVFELQHRCQTTRATNGFGYASSFGDSEIYSVVKIQKLL